MAQGRILQRDIWILPFNIGFIDTPSYQFKPSNLRLRLRHNTDGGKKYLHHKIKEDFDNPGIPK